MDRTPLLAVEGLQLATRDGSRLVRGVDMKLEAGERLAIVGESGSGKSLTALSLMGLLPRSVQQVAGTIELEGLRIDDLSARERAKTRGAELAMIAQDPMSSLNPVRRIGQQIAEGILYRSNKSAADARGETEDWLGAVGFPDPREAARAYPHELSGGMRQRVMIAIALSMNPRVVLADEPTTALDVATEARVLDLLFRLADEKSVAVVLITHDLGIATRYCETVLVMYNGRVVERGALGAVFAAPRHPYSGALFDSICHVTGPIPERLPTISGQPPSPLDEIPGCSFAPRCPHETEECTKAEPPLETIGDRSWACFHPRHLSEAGDQ